MSDEFLVLLYIKMNGRLSNKYFSSEAALPREDFFLATLTFCRAKNSVGHYVLKLLHIPTQLFLTPPKFSNFVDPPLRGAS